MMTDLNKNHRFLAVVIFLAFRLIATNANADGPYQPTWKSLATYPIPDWFQDGKFGIYTHWGIYSVPAHVTVEKAGAKFAGPCAEHHDGFAMWDSGLTEWDAVDKGPKVDVAGKLAEAINKRGMKFKCSSR